MSKATDLHLTGTGAAYIRVSTDHQDTLRQHNAIHVFEKEHGVKIAEDRWYEDQGWARDTADRRPQFQKLLGDVEAGRVQWIVVDNLDRFGTKSTKQLGHYLYRLEESKCRLFDVTGRDLTGDDIATEITTLVEGKNATAEVRKLSSRVQGEKAGLARNGEFQGGDVRFGFDLACFARSTPEKELWRVVFEGHHMRLKVYPDGREERYDGPGNIPSHQKKSEYLQIVPSVHKGRVEAAVRVFERYATEDVSPTALARELNTGGFTTNRGGAFDGHHVEHMLADPIYIGYFQWNKMAQGKYHRFKGGMPVPELNLDRNITRNDPADWVQSTRRLFDPLVRLETWTTVQEKLGGRGKRPKAPRTPELYLSRLVYCGHCGCQMVGGRNLEFVCGTYHKAARLRRATESPCRRNGVYQSEIDAYIERYLAETQTKLEVLTAVPDGKHLTDPLWSEHDTSWAGFAEGVKRLASYLATHHPDEYAAILREYEAQRAHERAEMRAAKRSDQPLSPGTMLKAIPNFRAACEAAKQAGPPEVQLPDFVAAVLECYRTNFDPIAVAAKLEDLQAEHDREVEKWGDLPTPLAKEKAKAKLKMLEADITELEQHQRDLTGVVERHYGEAQALLKAITDARIVERSESGERALRRKAAVTRKVVHRVECLFTAPVKVAGRPGRAKPLLAAVTIYPVLGDPAEYVVDRDVLPQGCVSTRS